MSAPPAPVLRRPSVAPVTGGGSGSGWRPALRVARRELSRAPGRTLVVLLMVLLPVTAVVALDTLLRTAEIDRVEALPRDLGTAQARVDGQLGASGPVRQTPDLGRVEMAASPVTGGPVPPSVDESALRTALPPGSLLLPVREGGFERGMRTADGRIARAALLGLDLRDPQARGPFAVLSGRAPATDDEVAVTEALRRLFPQGSTLVLPDGGRRTVTGTVAQPYDYGAPRSVVGLPAALGLERSTPIRWYVSGPEVTWDDVLEVNALGATVLSRAVLRDPPPDDQVPDLPSYDEFGTTVAVLGLVVVMAVLEVVLLAGPAFAVGARRQRRALALLAATGGEPRHVRRVVLAQGVLVGVGAAVLGVPLGLLVAALARAPLTRWSDAVWGPFDVSVRDVVLFALLGAGTAVLAALVPALAAGRAPVVASLHGRRPAPLRAALPTVAGLVLLVSGVLLCVVSLDQGFPELWIAFAALPTVIGAVLLAPVVLAGLGRVAGRLPLPLRYAVRDADRQRSRTAPAVAAVAATVAAAVALSVSATSDAAERRATYSPSTPPGAAVVTGYPPAGEPGTDWDALERAAREALPGEPVTAVRGLVLDDPLASPAPPGIAAPAPEPRFEELRLCPSGGGPSGSGEACAPLSSGWGGSLGSGVLVGEDAVDVVAPLLAPADVEVARRAVQEGGVVAPGAPAGQGELRRTLTLLRPDGTPGSVRTVARARVPVTALAPSDAQLPLLVSEQVATQLGGASTVALVVGDGLTTAQEEELRDAMSVVAAGVSVQVERGLDDDDGLVVLLLGLAAGTLVLAGSLAATSLALVEARSDFAVLGHVGARPRTRRAVSAAYAGVLAATGCALGTAAGLVPGVAAGTALTRNGSSSGWLVYGPGMPEPPMTSFVDVPWLLVGGLLVLVPLATAAVAALTTRSRLPVPTARRTA